MKCFLCKNEITGEDKIRQLRALQKFGPLGVNPLLIRLEKLTGGSKLKVFTKAICYNCFMEKVVKGE